MVAGRSQALFFIHYGCETPPGIRGQGFGKVQYFVILLPGVYNVDHIPVRGFQVALVADLPAPFRIKRGAVKNQLVKGPFLFGFHPAVFADSDFGLQFIVAQKIRA